jgi:hypothetical protein
MALGDETRITEISIAADGRIYIFGASRQVIELLAAIELGDPMFDHRVRHAVMRPDALAVDAVPSADSKHVELHRGDDR